MPSLVSTLPLVLLAAAAFVDAAPSKVHYHRHALQSRMNKARLNQILNKRACRVRAPAAQSSDTTVAALAQVAVASDIASAASVVSSVAASTPSDAYSYVSSSDSAVVASPAYTPPADTPAYTPSTSAAAYTAPAPAPAPAQSSGNTWNKAGLAITGLPESATALFAGRVSWAYNWSPYNVDSYATNGIEFVPQLWSSDYSHTQMFYANIGSYGQSGVSHILGFNEPEQAGQSNLSPEDAANAWRQLLLPYSGQYTLVGPACTSSPQSIGWQQSFMANLGGDAPAVMALHYYGTDPQAMIDYLNNFHNTFQKNIWVTEWACHDFSQQVYCDQATTDRFMTTAKAFMDNSPFIERYAYFGALGDMAGLEETNRLCDAAGTYLTGLGNMY